MKSDLVSHAPVDAGSDKERFRRPSIVSLPAGDDQVLIVRETGCRGLISRSDLGLLNSCTRFATLEAHSDALAYQRRAPTEVREVFRHRLHELATQGLLDRASCVARGGPYGDALPVDLPEPIRTVTIPTRDRPHLVARAVDSVAQAAKHASRRIDCILIDDSDKALQLPGCEGVQVIVVGRRERERLAKILASESGAPTEVVRRAVLGDPVHGWRAGAAYNTALLLAAGRMYLSIDDDTTLRFAASPVLQSRARATSVHDPTEFWFFPNLAAAHVIEPADIDPFEVVERVLGRTARAVLAEGSDASWVDDVAPALAGALGSGRGVVAATSFGVTGDSGMGNLRYYLYLRGDSLRRAAADDDTWRWVRTTRAVLRVSDSIVLSGGTHFMATSVGLDHRGFLPPFPPSGRGEDEQFARLLRHCSEDALIAHLPWAAFHDPSENRSAQLPEPGLVHLLAPISWVMQLHGRGLAVPAEERLVVFGAALEQFGRLPASAFREFMQWSYWKQCSEQIATLEAQFASTPAPAFVADLRRDIAALRARLVDGTMPLPFELSHLPEPEALTGLREYLVHFGELLSAWPGLVAAAKARFALEQLT